MTIDAQFGNLQEVALPQGIVRYRDTGTGPTLVFVHGVFVNSALWMKIIPSLSQRFRCIAPDLPLGAHSLPLCPDADLTPNGVADLVGALLEALDLHNVTLVGNDTGGAICQLTIARHPERITGLVLTSCDALEDFFPLLASPFQYGTRIFGIHFINFYARVYRSRSAQRGLMASVSHHKPDTAILDTFFTPIHDAGVRRDLAKFLRTVSNRYTLEAARSFAQFHHPVLLLWAKDDIFFSPRLARRLQQAFPDATLEFVSRSRTFVPLDQPEFLSQRIAEYINESVRTRT